MTEFPCSNLSAAPTLKFRLRHIDKESAHMSDLDTFKVLLLDVGEVSLLIRVLPTKDQ